ncbi:MAG TPA: class I SAM-dependent methyltransferase [Gemmatimonadaceae bacterium]
MQRRKLVPEMEGRMARWYARTRGTPAQLAAWRRDAAILTEWLPNGAAILEVAPGPGYLAVEIARLGRFNVTGLDVSRTMVDIATETARRAGVSVDFRHGDAAAMPFASGSFDLVVCQAAFKNFARPLDAIAEMHRVLRPGGVALVQDLSRDASPAAIDDEVQHMNLGRANAFVTKLILGTFLRRRAYTTSQLRELAGKSPFGACDIRHEGIGFELRLAKRSA